MPRTIWYHVLPLMQRIGLDGWWTVQQLIDADTLRSRPAVSPWVHDSLKLDMRTCNFNDMQG